MPHAGMDEPSTKGVGYALASALAIREGEGRKTALLFAQLLVASAIFILGRTVRDTLFLSRYPLSALPWMFVAFGVASALTVVVYARVADRLPRPRLIALSCLVGGVSYLATYAAVKAELSWIYPVFYVWSEVAANLFIVQFWTYANDLNEPRAARRLFPTIGSARVLGVVAIGLVAGAVVDLVGTEQLMLVLVALMAGLAGLALALARHLPVGEGRRPGARRRASAPVTRDPYVRALSTFLVLTFVALTIGDYQFKAIARETFREDALARYFGLFYAGTGVLSFLFQILATPRILQRFGVGLGMSVMPGLFGGASLLLLFAPHLAVATVMKFADNGLQYTLHDTTVQALYVPFPERVKARTRALLDAVVKPASYGIGGLVLVLLAPRVPVVWLSAVVVGLVALWLASVGWVRARYVAALQRTLGLHGAMDLQASDRLGSEATAVLHETLERGDAQVAALALEALEGPLPPALVPAVERVALYGAPRARRAALRALAGAGQASVTPVLSALQEPDAAVRAAAAEACGPIAGDGCVEPLTPRLDDADRRVRVQALTSLLVHGGVEGAIVGSQRLAELLRSGRSAERVEASEVLRRLGRAAYRPLRELLLDEAAEVRRAALRAAEQVADPRLIPLLVEALDEAPLAGRAGAALVAIGPASVSPLLARFEAPSSGRALRLVLPRLLRRIPCDEAFGRLLAHAEDPDGQVRLRVLAALASIHAKLRSPPHDASWVEARVRAELGRGYRRMAAFERARAEYGTPLFEHAHRSHAERTTKRVLRLLSLRHDKSALDLARKGLAQPSRRANALELLDGLLEPRLRVLVMPWLDDVPTAVRAARGAELAGEVPEPLRYLSDACADENPYFAALALDALAHRPSAAGATLARQALDHASPWVREVALVTLARSDRRAGVQAAHARLDDPSAVVRARARRLVENDAGENEEPPLMHTTLEKILLLKSARMFADVDPEDLAPMAHAAEEHTYEPGHTIVQEGEVGDVLYVVVHGEVSVVRGGVVLARLGPGETFGEMAVLDAEPRSATVRATEETTVLAVASEDFYDVLREQMEIAEGVIRMLTQRLRVADRAADPVSMVPPAPKP